MLNQMAYQRILSKQDHHTLLRMELCIMDIGREILGKVMGYRHGLMGLNIKDIGSIIKHMEKVNLHMLMETSMKENGKKTKLVE